MNDDFINILIENLNRIKNSPTESIHKCQFNYTNNEEFDLNQIVDFLVLYDFIETDRNDDVYFLTHETYDLIECYELETVIISKFKLDEETHEKLKNNESTELLENNTKKRKFDHFTYLPLLIIGISMTFYLYNKQVTKKKELPIFKFDKSIFNHSNDTITTTINFK